MKGDLISLVISDASNAASELFHAVSWLGVFSRRVMTHCVDFFMINQDWTTDHREWYRTVYLKSDHWRELKKAKFAANPTCERCGSADNLDAHHVNYRNIFDVQITDLLSLCRKCHRAEHEQNGMPVRKKISYWNYFPQPAIDKINQQRADKEESKRLHPQYDYSKKLARIAAAIRNGKNKWRKSDLKRGIPNPETTPAEWWFSEEAKTIFNK